MTSASRPECAAVLGGISAYLDGELGATECDAIERHCQTCEHCASIIQGLRDTIGLCRGAAVLSLPAPVRQRAQASIRALLKASPE